MGEWTMKTKHLIAVGIGLLLLIPLVCMTVLWQSGRAKVPLESLLADNPTFPSRWNAEGQTILVDWRVSTEVFSFKRGTFYAASSVGRIWTNGGDKISNPQISQSLFQYDNQIAAEMHYWLSQPEIAYGDDWPNFTFLDRYSNRYPSDWSYHSRFADREHVVCAMGAPESCQMWYYWARYGQYILQVEFFAPNQGMDTVPFAQVVEQLDTFVGQRLKK